MKQCINIEHSDIVNKWSTFHTFTIYWGLWETMAVDHLQIYISCLRQHAPLYRLMLILACLSGVSSLVLYLCQWPRPTHHPRKFTAGLGAMCKDWHLSVSWQSALSTSPSTLIPECNGLSQFKEDAGGVADSPHLSDNLIS